MPKLDRIRALVGWLPSSLLSTLASVHGTEKAAKYADWIGAPLTSRYWGISNDVTASIKRRMYSPELTNEAGAGVRTHFENLFGKMRDATSLRRMTYVDLKTWLPDDLLVKADKMTMACSLELRVPMLDHKLLEYCTALPDNLRIRNGEGKYLLKRVMERYLPREIIYRPKKGFPVPIAAWFRGPLFEPVSEILRDTRSRARGYFKPAYVENVLQQHRSGAEDLSRRIFSLLALELWHRRYID
jgi:asparagine synthase (glutamine-hydrolysing)